MVAVLVGETNACTCVVLGNKSYCCLSGTEASPPAIHGAVTGKE